MSLWSWVAMGVDYSYDKLGWYNDTTWKNWIVSDYNTQIDEKLSKHMIAESVRYFKNHPRKMLLFLMKSFYRNGTMYHFSAFMIYII